MCGLLGEIIEEKKAWYVTKKNLGCFMSLSGTGTCKNLPRDKYLKFMIEQNEMYRMHKDEETVETTTKRLMRFLRLPSTREQELSLAPFLRLTILIWSFSS